MRVKKFTFNLFEENTFVLWDNTKKCIIIDPGCYEKAEKNELVNFIEENHLQPEKLINTHCHIDHILGNKFVSEKWGLELYMHKKDFPLLEKAKDIAIIYGFKNYEASVCKKHNLEDGEILKFGNSELEILFTPGHAPGHICLLSKNNKFIVAGDVLFNGSIGRTDLPGGDFNTLIKSIKTKLFLLDNETLVYCGHGPSTTIGQEKLTNPFLK